MPPAASQGKGSGALDESGNENENAKSASDVRVEGAEGSSSGVVIAPLGPTTCASPQSPHVGTGEGDIGQTYKRKQCSDEIGKEKPFDDDDHIKKVRTAEVGGVRVEEAEGGRAAHGSRAPDINMGRRVPNNVTTDFAVPHQPSFENSCAPDFSAGLQSLHGNFESYVTAQEATTSPREALRSPPTLVNETREEEGERESTSRTRTVPPDSKPEIQTGLNSDEICALGKDERRKSEVGNVAAESERRCHGSNAAKL